MIQVINSVVSLASNVGIYATVALDRRAVASSDLWQLTFMMFIANVAKWAEFLDSLLIVRYYDLWAVNLINMIFTPIQYSITVLLPRDWFHFFSFGIYSTLRSKELSLWYLAFFVKFRGKIECQNRKFFVSDEGFFL